MPREEDEHIQDDDDRVRRRRKDDDPDADYDDEDRPRRRRRREDDDDDDYDRPRRHRNAGDRRGGFLDDTFADTSIVILVIFPLVCGIIALLMGIVGVAACQRPLARRNAWIVLVISICWMVAATVIVMNNPDMNPWGAGGQRR